MMIFRVSAGLFFLFRLIGWALYKYPIELLFTMYSFLMIIAFLCGVVYAPSKRPNLKTAVLLVYVAAIAVTLPYALHEIKFGISDASAMQSGLMRFGEILVLSALSVQTLKREQRPTRE